ncbi:MULTISPECIES: hypothetical protein [unclassified Avibacterium]|uniref:hypothetical protein n=1 Tax=unclassified Avibacterium TaxID=2685287 RepID=UPI0020275D64|nr:MULTISPECIES: hypothetical protein [unclassified Avibacterium]URL02195.1 hypothetical protein L4F91_00885 [Avibacterium sp. 20-126]MCW9698964.1 hypothetical protein [Avibacterium sp. 20-129]MCW9732739.1 hypothetical protein [Avibacterium sp. 20-15]URL04884.1 hypothetical protein L4F93_03095 [Avibacterium sp. 20-132]URL06832.1 hypothetical protein L4F92_01570 [Avibacterium sp. 21-595]
MMITLPHKIAQFLQQQTVMSLAVHNTQDFWAANCFYVLDNENVSLIFFSSLNTQHAQIMQQSEQVVGTIATQTDQVSEIEGVQFKGRAILLDGNARQSALKRYYARYPFARLMNTDLWKIELDEIKHTSNKCVFAQKTYWKRTSAV